MITMRLLVPSLLVALGLTTSLAAAAEADFTGAWSGSFDIHLADGRVIHDSAWLVLQKGSGASLTGTVGPKPDQQAPIRNVTVRGSELRFVADSTQGKTLQFVLVRDGGRLTGEAKGEIGEDTVRAVIDTARVVEGAEAAPDALHRKLLVLDEAMFDAFNRCDDPAQLARHAAFFDKDVEFFHDVGGLTIGADAVIATTRQNVCGKYRRELDPESFRVYPIPGFGALSFGTHRFCRTSASCEGVAEFTMVWREKDGQWHVTRALSYAHRALK